MNKALLILVSIALVISLISLGINLKANKGQFGSVSATNEYYATSTPYGIEAWADGLIYAGDGSLGSVIITKAGDTEFVLYNATSTGAIANDSRFIKSNKQLARITENLAAGVYTFDVMFSDGLVIDVLRGSTGTSTITWRY